MSSLICFMGEGGVDEFYILFYSTIHNGVKDSFKRQIEMLQSRIPNFNFKHPLYHNLSPSPNPKCMQSCALKLKNFKIWQG